MRAREFVVSFSSNVFEGKDALHTVNNAFEELGYRPITNDPQPRIGFSKGSKLATYMGLVNWDLIFRKVEVEIVNDEAKVLLHYRFSWLTNIGMLVNSSEPELRSLQHSFGAKTLKVERYR